MSEYRCDKCDVAECGRCKMDISVLMQASDGVMTIGYYDVRADSWWAQFANAGEKYLCDACMWKDPRYIAVYGRHDHA